MVENCGLSDWNGINSEIENEKTAPSNYDRSGLTDGSSEAKIIDGTKAPKVGGQNPPDFSPNAVRPEGPGPEPVSGWREIIPTLSLDEAASSLRRNLFSGSQSWDALRSPILDLITGKSCFTLGSALVSGVVGNCGIVPLQTVGSIEDVYWKAVGDDLSKWKNAAREVYKETIEFPSQVYENAKDKYAEFRKNAQGVDLVLSAFGADLGIPIYTVKKGWFKGTPTVDFSTTLSGCNLRFNFKDETKLNITQTGDLSTDQLSDTFSINIEKPRGLRYFGMSFNCDDSRSILFGATVAMPFYNPSISADAAARTISDYGIALGKELGKINQRFVGRIDRILYDR